MDNSYPLGSYAHNYSNDVDYNAASPSNSWKNSRFGPGFSTGSKVEAHAHESEVPGYAPLTQAYNGYEPSPPQPVQKTSGGGSSILWWWPELLASLIAVACLIAIIVVLRYYNGRPLDDINLPGSLNLNGIIAAIATLARVALMVPIASGLSQESWIWFAKDNHQHRQRRSRLKDLDLSDNASRGAWGSFLFLLLARGRWLAYVGALATIISLGFGTFVQQLLAIGQFTLDKTSPLAPGNLPRLETWQYYNLRPSEGAQSLPLDLRAALYNGILTDHVDPITVTCPTGNCTWPITPSLAVCGACAETEYLQSCDASVCNYTMASGSLIQLTTSGDYGIGYSVVSSPTGGVYNGSLGDRLYINHFDAVGAPYNSRTYFSNSNVTASECALWLCIQSFDTSMVAGKLHQVVTMEFSDLESPTTDVTGGGNYTFASLPNAMRPDPDISYTVSTLGAASFYSTITGLFNGSAFVNQGGATTANDAIEAIWNASSSLDPWIKNVAFSLTNVLRYNNPNPHPASHVDILPTPRRSTYDGTASILGVRVQWHWIVLPIACVALSILFLFIVMIKTARQHVAPWKGSPLAYLFFEVDTELKQRVSGRVNDWRGVLNAVGDDKVVLREDHEGRWMFKTA